jgi:hypothetical protein
MKKIIAALLLAAALVGCRTESELPNCGGAFTTTPEGSVTCGPLPQPTYSP